MGSRLKKVHLKYANHTDTIGYADHTDLCTMGYADHTDLCTMSCRDPAGTLPSRRK